MSELLARIIDTYEKRAYLYAHRSEYTYAERCFYAENIEAKLMFLYEQKRALKAVNPARLKPLVSTEMRRRKGKHNQ